MSQTKPKSMGDCSFCCVPVIYGTPYTCCMCEGGCEHSVAHQCCVELAEAQDEQLAIEVGLLPEKPATVVM